MSNVLRLDFTLHDAALFAELAYLHERLKRRVERAHGYPVGSIQHAWVKTREGNGVLHCLWTIAWKPGQKRKQFFVPWGWLKEEWRRITRGAFHVKVKPFRRGAKSTANFSKYVTAHYFADQSDHGGKSKIAYHSYSRGLFGFPLVKAWKMFLRKCAGLGMAKLEIYKAWGDVLRGREVALPDGSQITRAVWSLAVLAGSLFSDRHTFFAPIALPRPSAFALTARPGAVQLRLGGVA